jgi:hypothetical protein
MSVIEFPATLKEGTARSILKHAGIGEDEFFQVY